MIRFTKTKYFLLKILGLTAFVCFPIWINILSSLIGNRAIEIIHYYFNSSSYILWFFIILIAVILAIGAGFFSFHHSKKIEFDYKLERQETLYYLRKLYKERLNQKMANEPKMSINLTLSFSNEETNNYVVEKYVIDNINTTPLKGYLQFFDLFISDIKRLVIIGEPGSGKSLLLINFANYLVDKALSDENLACGRCYHRTTPGCL